jgi:hypothetical protein
MITINGTDHDPRALTLPEVRKCQSADADESDVMAISFACGVELDVARAWFNSTPAGPAAAAIQSIFVVSGLTEGATKSG